MSDIFISYSKADHALALKLSAFLEAEGWTVWWDKSLAAADLYRDEIMKQLAAARAVITIWTANSIKSDWVRAEAGRAKAEGKLIPVKTTDVAYADIPLPFGEMHTENVGSTELIRAAIVAQLAKPAVSQSPFWQITSTFKYQALTWIGIVGSAITVFSNLSGVLGLADWAKEIVANWHVWTQIVWGVAFIYMGVTVPKYITTIMSFIVFTTILVVGVNLSAPAESRESDRVMKKVGIVIAGVLLIFVSLFGIVAVIYLTGTTTLEHLTAVESKTLAAVIWLWIIGFTIGYLMCFVKGRSWVFLNSVLFIVMIACLVLVPFSDVPDDEWLLSGIGLAALEACWMAVILFSPPQQLTRRLGFVVLGVITLGSLSEISKLNLHQYLQPPKVSDNSVR
jgi:hypothetical protein